MSTTARRRLGVIVSAVLLLLLGAGDGRAAAPVIKGDAQAGREVLAAMTKFAEARTWRTRMSSAGTIMTFEYVAPDRYHLTLGQGADRMEVFIIGTQQWTRTGSRCTRSPIPMPVPNPKEMMEHGGAEATVTVSRIGPATIEGTATQAYAVTIESKGTTVREKMYVATATGYPRRLEIEDPRGTMVVDYTDFNAPITINDPPC